MSSLRSALDELAAEDVEHTSDQQLEEDFVELERIERRLTAERARRLGEIQRRFLHRKQEYISLRGWVAKRLLVSHTVAERLVALARGLPFMDRTRRALAEGEVSSCAAHRLAVARKTNPGEFDPVEEPLVEAAASLPYRDLRNAVAYWRQAADPAGVERDAVRAHALRYLRVSPTFQGMVRVDGDLDPETGQTLVTALRAVEDAEVRRNTGPDARTPSQRRADALGEVCRQWLDSSERPEVAGERPHVSVVVDLEVLGGGAGRCELKDVGPITPETARRIVCDAGVSRVITKGCSEPLEVGRSTRSISPAMRRALVLRDGGCAVPTCDRPEAWCDGHHVEHWVDGGETGLSNLALLCRPHHRAVHERRFSVEIVEGRPVFRWPSGALMEEPRGP